MTPPEKRSSALGLATAAGSFGQFALLPVGQWLISWLDWKMALIALAVLAASIVPLAGAMAGRPAAHSGAKQSVGAALGEAWREKSFHLIFWGFFVCGFQVVFIGVHLPSYLLDKGLPANVGVTALALIGLFNIVGTYSAGWLGGKISKKYILSAIYFGRAIVIALFLLLPLSALTVYAFAIGLGLLWLSTVPPTNGIVAQIFGVRYLAMLSGFTFLSHQIGSFLGAWLGGLMFDRTGSYNVVWYLAIALGVVAGLLNLPIDERELKRGAAARVTA